MMKKHLLLTCLLVLFTALPVTAYDEVPVDGDNYSYIFNIYHKGENSGIDDGEGDMISAFTLLNNYRLPIFTSAKNWASIINSTTTEPLSYAILGDDDYNAGALSPYTRIEEGPYQVTLVNAKINGFTPIPDDDDDDDDPDIEGFISVGLGIDPDHPGWASFSGYHALNHSELSDLNSVILHELMHSLGVSSNVQRISTTDPTYYFSDTGEPISIFDKDLRLYQDDPSDPFDPSKELAAQAEMSVGEDEEFDIVAYSPYYVGDATIKVLGNNDNYALAKQAIIDNGGLTNYSSAYARDERPQVFGLPIHPQDSDETPELSHLEVRNSFMSHQMYRNWLVPMEAELALLKDIGYDIDLRSSFGKSYYLNNVTDTFTGGFSQWDGSSYTGTPSDVVQAVGLHIYGNNNTITQAADILTAGEGSFGVRIDGTDNDYTLQSGQLIAANGKENIGLGVTWGENHDITLETGSAITASADDGIAVSFDFGANLFGLYGDNRGSYINFNSDFDMDVRPEEETTDPLVSNFNVAGTLTGGKVAIYISDNAHVENINLLDGALINGDIISQWNSVSSGLLAKVQTDHGSYWGPVDPDDPSQIYFTQLNVAAGDSVNINGKIDAGNEIYNTLQLRNAGNLSVSGDLINVNALDNTGTINLTNATLYTQTGEVNGDGTISIADRLDLSEDLNTIENTLSLASGAVLSTLNDQAQSSIEIDTLKSYGGKISFDLGDTLSLQNADAADDATIHQIKMDASEVGWLDNPTYLLFDTQTLDLGASSATIYYNGNRYTLTQDADPHYLSIATSAGGAELADAAADTSAANYIVTDGTLTKHAGSVQGDTFEISGNDIDVNGFNGLVIDGTDNPQGTTLRTGISGAADSDLSVQNGGELLVSAQDKPITLGQTGQTALTLSAAEVMLDSAQSLINVYGDIRGTNALTDIVSTTGDAVNFNGVSNITLRLAAQQTTLNDRAESTAFELNGSALNVVQDDYLADAGDNELVVNGGGISLSNNKASDIALAKMTLNNDLITSIDVDFQTMSADRFVFQNSADLQTNSHLLYIAKVNVLNPQVVLEQEKYVIPVASADTHSENFLGGVAADIAPYTLQSPIFRYNVSFEQTDTYAGLVLAHGPNNDYRSYNPAVLAGPVAAQLGGYLAQLTLTEQAFTRMGQYRTLSADTLPEKDSANVWATPYGAWGKVPLKRGPQADSTLYGTAAGIDSPRYDIGRDWNALGGFYAAYNGSRQRFDGVSVRQNGGAAGVSGIAYKGNFYAGLLVGTALNRAQIKAGYGHDNASVQTFTTAAKTGYTWELGERGQWLLEPELLTAYTRVHTPAYTNKSGVRIKADPLQALTLQPSVRVAGNFQFWGQPYAEIAWVGSVGDKTDFQAQSVDLPQFAVKPYMKYGLGIRQIGFGRWSGHLQTYLTSGGVRNFGVQAGVSYAL